MDEKEILPPQETTNKNFFERNKTLLITIIVTILILWTGVNIYVKVSLDNLSETLNNLPK